MLFDDFDVGLHENVTCCNQNIWLRFPKLGLELLVALDVRRRERILDVLNQRMVAQNLLVEINQLVLIVLYFRTVPFVLVGVLEEPAGRVGIDADLEVLSLVSVSACRCDRILDNFEAFVDVVVCIEEGTVGSTLEGGQALLGCADGLFDGLLDFYVGLVDVQDFVLRGITALLFLAGHLLPCDIVRIHVNNQIKTAEFDF